VDIQRTVHATIVEIEEATTKVFGGEPSGRSSRWIEEVGLPSVD
jgi:hypothetical protein